MIKRIIFILIIGLVSKTTVGQKIDTLYSFYPKLNKKPELSNLDSIVYKQRIIFFKKDVSDSLYLNVTILNLKGDTLEEGRYLFDSPRISHNLVFDRKGNMTKKIRRVNFVYLREGYWYKYKKDQKQNIYYDKGEKLKMRINE